MNTNEAAVYTCVCLIRQQLKIALPSVQTNSREREYDGVVSKSLTKLEHTIISGLWDVNFEIHQWYKSVN